MKFITGTQSGFTYHELSLDLDIFCFFLSEHYE
jgi:hypothetical protein